MTDLGLELETLESQSKFVWLEALEKENVNSTWNRFFNNYGYEIGFKGKQAIVFNYGNGFS